MIKAAAAFVVVLIFYYLISACLMKEFNPLEWSESYRYFIALVSIMVGGLFAEFSRIEE